MAAEKAVAARGATAAAERAVAARGAGAAGEGATRGHAVAGPCPGPPNAAPGGGAEPLTASKARAGAKAGSPSKPEPRSTGDAKPATKAPSKAATAPGLKAEPGPGFGAKPLTASRARAGARAAASHVPKAGAGPKSGPTPAVAAKRAREQEVVSQMIGIWCHARHGTPRERLCEGCAELEAYARARSERCPFMETKTFCSNCRVHCYRAEMRERIREVMRFSGPRMLLHRPVMACRHVIEARREKRRIEREMRDAR